MSEESLEGLKMCGQRSLLINIGQRVETRGQMFDEGVNEISILIFMGITVLGRQSLPLSLSSLVFHTPKHQDKWSTGQMQAMASTKCGTNIAI